MTSPDYIRGQRDAFERAAEIIEVGQPTFSIARGEQSVFLTPRLEGNLDGLSYAKAIRAEAAKLPEADGIDWRALVDDADTRADELASQCDRLLAQRDAAETALAAMTERARRAEEALRPFAELHNEGSEDFPDNEAVVAKFGRTSDFTLVLGDIRRAAAVLTEEGAP